MLMLAAAALLTGSIGDFRLESGKTIPDCKITYRTFGQMNARRSNIVVIPTWFNGISDDWIRFIRAEGIVDNNKFYVIVIDALADGNSSSPSNHPTLQGEKFPDITIRDMVESEHRLLVDVLGITKVHAVMGVSMGAMQTFQWLVSYPDFMERAVSIVGTPRMSEKDMELWSTAVKIPTKKKAAAPAPPPAVKSDPFGKWIGMISTAASMYEKYKQPFNALRQFEAIATHDITKTTKTSLDGAAAKIKAPLLFVIATKDQAVYPETPLHFAELMKAPVVKLDGPCGHKAYDCELDKISGPIDAFLSGASSVQATGQSSEK